MDHHPSSTIPDRGIGWTFVLAAFLAIAAFFLWTEHRAHLLGALPYVILLACPALHLLRHRRHRGHDARGGGETTQPPSHSRSCH